MIRAACLITGVYKRMGIYDHHVLHTQNNIKTCFFYVLYSDKTWVFDQSKHVQGPIYILNSDKTCIGFLTNQSSCRVLSIL